MMLIHYSNKDKLKSKFYRLLEKQFHSMMSVKIHLVTLTFILCQVTLQAQQNTELGVRITQSPYNKIQLEFRKPFNDKYAMRSDSLITMRHHDGLENYYDLRFGINRILKNSPFSIHGDLILGYNRNYYRKWNYYLEADSMNTWDYKQHINSIGRPIDDASLTDAYDHFLSAGLSLGLTFDYPLGKRFVLSINLNHSFVTRFQFNHSERNDIYNEFYEGNSTLIEFYSTAGIGLRYKFGVSRN
jgi:hypothetical protein